MIKHAGGRSAGMAMSFHSCAEHAGYLLYLKGWETMVRRSYGAEGKGEVTLHAY
ncbi:hypothetical protein MHH56_24535 [Paenibacillus sp. FSL K6-3182]|uniref:hypothetical protein n=1 Tax=unclassified Paenibacillus TaxID=185978 RepID=UPI0030CFEC75